MSNLAVYSYKEHFWELKRRLFFVVLFFVAAFLGSYLNKDIIGDVLLKPLIEADVVPAKVIYTTLPEAFVAYLELSAFSALLFTVPFISYQSYAFLAPGLYSCEKNVARILFLLAPLLFLSACFFVYFLVIPVVWNFFLSFRLVSNLPLAFEAKISEYFSLIIKLMTAFGVAFELPVVLIILFLLKIISLQGMIKKRRIAIVLNFILAAILTPPDVMTQFMLAVPLCLLYEIAILVCKNINLVTE